MFKFIMKAIMLRRMKKVVFIALGLVITILACKKEEDEVIPDYNAPLYDKQYKVESMIIYVDSLVVEDNKQVTKEFISNNVYESSFGTCDRDNVITFKNANTILDTIEVDLGANICPIYDPTIHRSVSLFQEHSFANTFSNFMKDSTEIVPWTKQYSLNPTQSRIIISGSAFDVVELNDDKLHLIQEYRRNNQDYRYEIVLVKP